VEECLESLCCVSAGETAADGSDGDSHELGILKVPYCGGKRRSWLWGLYTEDLLVFRSLVVPKKGMIDERQSIIHCSTKGMAFVFRSVRR
jgi:hypothetical protein